MKLMFVFVMAGLLSVHAEVYSQVYSVSMKNAQLREVMQKIEDQSDYRFFFSDDVTDLSRNVQVNVVDATIDQLLNNILSPHGLGYKIMDNLIIISPYTASKLQQMPTITGTVLDAYGDPLAGVTVIVEGTSIGTITDNNGKYTINATPNSTLVFSFIGFATQRIAIGQKTTIDVRLTEDALEMGEVVVTALGIKREQKAIGYAAQQIKGDEIIRANTANIASALSGKIAGVNINNANQLDGGSSRIVIRGNNNIQGNNQPLIVIDGMPLENNPSVNISSGSTSEATDKVRDLGSGLNFINNNDIEDMSILKGPAAAALYGARGANGVILITTKKGVKKEGLGVDYSFTTKIINPYKFRDQQTEYGYGGLHYPMYSAVTKYQQDADGNYLYPKNTWADPRWDVVYGRMPNGYMTYDQFSWHAYSMSWGPKMDGTMVKWWDGEMRPHVADPDYEKYYYKNGHTNTHNVSFSGGGEFGTVRVGLTREDHSAVIDNSDFNRTAVTLGANLNISRKLKAEVYATYNNYDRHNIIEIGGDNDGITKAFYIFPSDYKPSLAHANYKNADGSRPGRSQYYGDGGQGHYIFWNLYENSYDYERDQLLGSVKLTYSPVEWLSFSGQVGLDYHVGDIVNKRAPIDIYGLESGYYQHKLNKESVINADFIATARKNDLFVDKFNASFSLGATRWDRKYYQMEGQTSGKYFKDPYIYTFGNYDLSKQSGVIQSDQIPVEDILNKRINSVYGFLDLSYGDFIYAQVTGRNDWSSTLPLGSNSYFYPSASLSFVPTALLDMPNWFNFGKIRLAYASAATDADPYQVVPTYQTGSFGGAPIAGLRETIPPSNLKPQRADSYEFGLGLSMFEHRFNFDFTYYHTKSYNQIMAGPVPSSSGYNSVRFNTGKMENKGIEIIAGYHAVRNKDWDLRFELNLARNKNKLLSMGEGVNVFEIGQIFSGNGPIIQVEVGDSYGNIYGWDYERDANGNKIIDVIYDKNEPNKVAGTKYKTTKDRVKIGNITPDVIGGLNANLRWKNLSLYALVGFSYGGDLWSGTYATSLSSGLSPETLYERNGGGLPYTYSDGTTANHGIVMDGVLADGTPNTHVVHYAWKYGQLGSWGAGNLTTPSILENNWVKMNEITISYDLPQDWVKRLKIFQSLSLMASGRDLFYIYSSLPDNLNPAALSNSAGNAQGLEFGALPGMRTFSFTLKAGF
ncbi:MULTISPECIES: SusC/RagA family TonB-linked outer membrane protein [unclassified Parabacteroides]|uniref:SusC/RagA family TonB-linked outer membrane protein n=1 Tax=unclassified Parabacteroides TaxID=2649774 RepID=UPI002475AB4C|nr:MULTISPECIES: SusC/RagA family TonB-linked outer membrane protein [unclassified Parabacteroides]